LQTSSAIVDHENLRILRKLMAVKSGLHVEINKSYSPNTQMFMWGTREKKKIVFLNGTSSSGKTTIAKEILKSIDASYLSIDDFTHVQNGEGQEFKEHFPEIINNFHKTIKNTANNNVNVIIDHVLEKPEWYESCKEALKDLNVIWVSVIAPIDVLEKRELARKDRNIGFARLQYDRVYKDYIADIVIDTSKVSPEEAATMILNN